MTSKFHPEVHKSRCLCFAGRFLLLVAGALVTSNDAALAVPIGRLPWHVYAAMYGGHFFTEHSHPLIAGALESSLIIEAIVIWRPRRAALAALVCISGSRRSDCHRRFWAGKCESRLLHCLARRSLHACFAQIMFGAICAWRFLPPVVDRDRSRAR